MLVQNNLIKLIIIFFIPFVFSQDCGSSPDYCNSNAKFRSIDGSCNNLKNPKWGSAGSEYGRILPASFSDKNGSFPITASGQPLPNARKISLMLYPDKPVKNRNLTLNAVAYGQFLAHDLSFIYLSTKLRQCCTPTLKYLSHPKSNCVPIHISEDDPVYSKYGSNCMPMSRTNTNREHNCSNDREVEKLNFVTSYIDLHMNYGLSQESAAYLRTFKNGMLNSTLRHGQRWLPDTTNSSDDCPTYTDAPVCYKSVDPRVNQNIDLSLLHTIFMREHLRIASELAKLNQGWDDERIYQETRSIMVAIHQHIAYNEWLPIILGRKNLLERKIIYEGDIFIDDYDENEKLVTYNEFAQAANRHFHSMIADKIMLSPDGRYFSGYVNMSDWMNNPTILEKDNNFDDFIRGLQLQHSMANDQYHGIQVTSQIFRSHFPLGFDLKAMDIHRSRDHGVAFYNDMREYCGLPRASSFDDFGDVISKSDIERLKQIYEHVDDVELVVAGVMEQFVPDALTGPSFFCILTKQYKLSRVADRFWYQNGRSGLTLSQLKEIHKVTISKVLCNNGRNIEKMQPHGFHPVSSSNDLVPCKQLPSMDLSLWKDKLPESSMK